MMDTLPDTVFIVSSDGLVRSAVEHIMTLERWPTVSIESAAECLAYVREMAPVCVILDVTLSDMSGLQLQQELADQGLPIVFVTRQNDVSSSVQAIKAGALDFLVLPAQPQVLLRSVQSAVALGTAMRARRQKTQRLRLRVERLSPREHEVLTLMLSGLASKQIAGKLGISDITAQVHRRRAMQKMGASSMADLLHRAELLGMTASYETDALPRHSVAPISQLVASERTAHWTVFE